MSAALVLDFSGPATRCDFPRCTLEAFHGGDHEFPKPAPVLASKARYFTCEECGGKFVVYGERVPGERNVCDAQECLLAMCRRDNPDIPLLCPCSQRSYPHELHIHHQLRSESYNPKLKYRWPWVLALSERLEMSTERKGTAA